MAYLTAGSRQDVPGRMGRREVLVVFSGLLLALLMALLDQAMVATALPTIAGGLHSLNHLAWVVTAYLLAVTVVMPIYGKLGDLFGRKPVFQFAIVVFLLGSAACGTARTMTEDDDRTCDLPALCKELAVAG
jgi:MFS family permease